MRYRLPSLNALRAFEAAARHQSVSAASKDLLVSPGAVSRQIALLEAHFECQLFVRNRRGLELTEKGRRFYGEISEAFDRIDAASAHLRGQQTAPTLSVRVYPTFATEWLLPRLSAFRKLHPWIDFRLRASVQDVDFISDEADVGVLHTPPDRSDLRQDLLFLPRYFPVCSPDLLQHGPPLRDAKDLREHTLLYTTLQASHWQSWLAAAGVAGIDLRGGLGFESSSLVYRAAREGVGVALGQHLFLVEDLVSGRLIAPFKLTIDVGRAYCLVSPAKRADAPHVVAFRRWIMSEMAESVSRSQALLARLEKRVLRAHTQV